MNKTWQNNGGLNYVVDRKIGVSIICNTYNHESYIRHTLESFFMQKTDFNIEILVHDDASTDGTQDIIKEYENKYPDVVLPIYQKTNQYSLGEDICFKYQFPRVRGKYIAFCEGDDYWTDKYKLQKQFNEMEVCPNINICTHAVCFIKNGISDSKIEPATEKRVFSPGEVIAGGGGFVGTNSIFMRSTIIHKIPKFVEFLPLDYTYQIWGSLEGGMLYLPYDMSAYRFNVNGSWTERMNNNYDLRINHLKKVYKMFNILMLETGRTYSKEIRIKKIKVTKSIWKYRIRKLIGKKK